MKIFIYKLRSERKWFDCFKVNLDDSFNIILFGIMIKFRKN